MDKDWVSVDALYQEIREVYLASKRDWIIAYSGGKDSTATLQLIWYALTSLPPPQRKYHVFVVMNDTLVEDPAMAVRMYLSCQRINAAAQAEADAQSRQHPDEVVFPLFSAHVVKPKMSARFFYLLLGLGYPPPTVRTRWCVSRLKILPAQTFIQQHISEKGEVVITLGAREEESTTRAQSLRKHALPNQLLKRHSTMHGAWVYTPIEVWSTDDVWIYLLQVVNPWGDINRDLLALYKSSSGECPLVVDRKTPSCAGTRMGCWTCSVVRANRSLEHRVDDGEDWLIPLLQFRDHLLDMTDPEKKHLYRSLESRGSHLIQVTRQGNPSYRCLTLETRKDLVRRLLQTQVQVRQDGPDPCMNLIDFEELCEIRRAWHVEGDWEDSLPQIYLEIIGHDEEWPVCGIEAWKNVHTKEALLYYCQQQQLPPQLMMELLETWKEFQRLVSEPVILQEQNGLVPLFEEDPTIIVQQKALKYLVEQIAALFFQRDWREHQERLAEAIERYKPRSSPTFDSWM